jgi:hypothetical protein
MKYQKTTHSTWLKISLLIPILGFIGCSQDEGIGGTASIKGQLQEQFYNDDYSILLYEQPCKDKDVFITFGDNKVIGEKTTTSYNGDFEFKFLWPGNYTVFYYSQNTKNTELGDEEVVFDINLNKGQSKDLGQIMVYHTLDWDEGTATIKGKIEVVNYKNSSEWPDLVIKDISPAQEQEVYLTYGNHEFYDERIRTQADGSFEFQNLIKGKYTIFVYSEDLTGATQHKVVKAEVEIKKENEVVQLEVMQIDKL